MILPENDERGCVVGVNVGLQDNYDKHRLKQNGYLQHYHRVTMEELWRTTRLLSTAQTERDRTGDTYHRIIGHPCYVSAGLSTNIW